MRSPSSPVRNAAGASRCPRFNASTSGGYVGSSSSSASSGLGSSRTSLGSSRLALGYGSAKLCIAGLASSHPASADSLSPPPLRAYMAARSQSDPSDDVRALSRVWEGRERMLTPVHQNESSAGFGGFI
jgi:hypothetical protein